MGGLRGGVRAAREVAWRTVAAMPGQPPWPSLAGAVPPPRRHGSESRAAQGTLILAVLSRCQCGLVPAGPAGIRAVAATCPTRTAQCRSGKTENVASRRFDPSQAQAPKGGPWSHSCTPGPTRAVAACPDSDCARCLLPASGCKHSHVTIMMHHGRRRWYSFASASSPSCPRIRPAAAAANSSTLFKCLR